jgi:hypothetical protein
MSEWVGNRYACNVRETMGEKEEGSKHIEMQLGWGREGERT